MGNNVNKLKALQNLIKLANFNGIIDNVDANKSAINIIADLLVNGHARMTTNGISVCIDDTYTMTLTHDSANRIDIYYSSTNNTEGKINPYYIYGLIEYLIMKELNTNLD